MFAAIAAVPPLGGVALPPRRVVAMPGSKNSTSPKVERAAWFRSRRDRYRPRFPCSGQQYFWDVRFGVNAWGGSSRSARAHCFSGFSGALSMTPAKSRLFQLSCGAQLEVFSRSARGIRART
jgi:hypothetical protein